MALVSWHSSLLLAEVVKFQSGPESAATPRNTGCNTHHHETGFDEKNDTNFHSMSLSQLVDVKPVKPAVYKFLRAHEVREVKIWGFEA